MWLCLMGHISLEIMPFIDIVALIQTWWPHCRNAKSASSNDKLSLCSLILGCHAGRIFIKYAMNESHYCDLCCLSSQPASIVTATSGAFLDADVNRGALVPFPARFDTYTYQYAG